jgi:phage shock protein E
MASSPWQSGMIFLVGLTAALGLLYILLIRAPRPLTPAAARAAVADKEFAVIIDVRSPEEYAAGHYHAARNIPLSSLVSALPRDIPDRDTPILFYCRIGRRAAQAATIAADLGYTNIAYLIGGDYTTLDTPAKIMRY